MPFVPSEDVFSPAPPGASDSLSNAEIELWQATLRSFAPWIARRDQPVDSGLASARSGFGYEIKRYYKSPNRGIEFFKGEQG